MSNLYLVSTPIGNLGDLSERARGTLEKVSTILAEDTRRTRKLLTHLGIDTPMVSLHAHNEASREATILEWLGEGKELAVVSDAGTPLVSDPGYRIVDAVLEAGYRVVPIPGPSAVLAALVGSGLSLERFSFQGFPPRKGRERTSFLERVAASSETVVLFESPERLMTLLKDLAEIAGGQRRGAVARELTKVHEEFVRGSLSELQDHFQASAPRGEITLVVEAGSPTGSSERADLEAARALAQALLEEGVRPSQVARDVAGRLGIARNRVYELVQDLSRTGGEGAR